MYSVDPLLYDRCIRRFQSAAEREADGRKKGWSGVLEADMERSEAKLAALANPETTKVVYRRDSNGEIYPVDSEDLPKTKEEGAARWRAEMTQRFMRGEDDDFDYSNVDNNSTWDNKLEEDRDAQDEYFEKEEPSWIHDSANSSSLKGETGVQDF
jgi:hypothetical protein